MGVPQKPNGGENLPSSKVSSEIGSSSGGEGGYSARIKGPKYPNPPETEIPDTATLREQWRFAIRQYSKWYSHAWGTAILAGGAFFALGWIIKGSNPLPSFQKSDAPTDSNPSSDNPPVAAAADNDDDDK